jgi:hypothetical protein
LSRPVMLIGHLHKKRGAAGVDPEGSAGAIGRGALGAPASHEGAARVGKRTLCTLTHMHFCA